jgi:hypothetical protein
VTSDGAIACCLSSQPQPTIVSDVATTPFPVASDPTQQYVQFFLGGGSITFPLDTTAQVRLNPKTFLHTSV